MLRNLGLFLCLAFVCATASANTFVVTNNADSGPGSLRDAILQSAANGTGSSDLISFNIPYTNAASITIQLLSSLPTLTSNLTIDASTQPSGKLGISDARIIIEPNDIPVTVDSCLTINDATNIQIYGLCIRNFADYVQNGDVTYRAAIWLYNVSNFIFGAPGKGNVIAGCTYGLFKSYTFGQTSNFTIQSNFFGVDVDGATRLKTNNQYTNYSGVELTLTNNAKVGGSLPQEGNLFTGNLSGVGFIELTGTVEVGNNKFGTDITGNTEIYSGAMGGRNCSATFFIHDNIIIGECDFNYMSSRFLIVNNFFGTNPTQTNYFSNGILDFNNCTGAALIGGNDASTQNVFAYGVLGVGNGNSTKITILHNSFYCHQEDGIYLNNWYTLPNKPFITINSISPTSIKGKARPNSIIELYQTDHCNHCEGKNFITRLNADATGNWQYNNAIPTDITGTATNFDDSTTSGFAQPQIDISKAVITGATCNKSNGKITGIQISSGTTFTWTDFNGNIVGSDTNLVNMPAGQYQLSVSIGSNNCKASTQSFIISGTAPPSIDNSLLDILQPACGGFNGSVRYSQNVFPDSAYWLNPTGDTLAHGILLSQVAQGNYVFGIALGVDHTCFTNYSPISLINQSGPTVDITQASITPGTCHQANGSIINILYSNITGTASYFWYDSLNEIVGTGADLNNVQSGKYYLKFKDQSSCDTIKTSFITISSNGLVSIDQSAALITTAKCNPQLSGSITNIRVTNGFTNSWIDTLTRSVVGAGSDLQNVISGYYKLIVTSAAGCTDSSKTIQVPLEAPVPYRTSSITVNPEHCDNQNGAVVIVPSDPSQSGFQFEWINNTTQQTVSNTLSLQNAIAGSYTCYVTDINGCKTLLTNANITNLPAPVIDDNSAHVTPENCSLGNGTVDIVSISGYQPFTYAWYDNANQQVSQTTELSSAIAGTYYLIVNDTYHCADTSAIITVPSAAVPPAAPGYDNMVVLKGTTATLNILNWQTGLYSLYATSIPTNPDQTNSTGHFITGPIMDDTAVYVVLVTGSCTSMAPVEIKAIEKFDLVIPNAFTPNGDGVNDIFRIKYPFLVRSATMTVFNRWGQKVFESSDPAAGWDGTLNGLIQPMGNYVYFILYTDLNSAKRKISGNVMLIR